MEFCSPQLSILGWFVVSGIAVAAVIGVAGSVLYVASHLGWNPKAL